MTLPSDLQVLSLPPGFVHLCPIHLTIEGTTMLVALAFQNKLGVQERGAQVGNLCHVDSLILDCFPVRRQRLTLEHVTGVRFFMMDLAHQSLRSLN